MNMEPVVNGLEADYAGRVDFRALNAGEPRGLEAFRAYALPGHPGFVLLNPAGEVLWRGFGELPADAIAEQLDRFLDS